MTKKNLQKPAPINIIATGFDPFDGMDCNPSQDVIKYLAKQSSVDNVLFQSFSISAKVLPTCCDESWQNLNQLVKENIDKPFLLLITGLADKQSKILLERFALNVRHYRIADNNGHKHNDEYLDDKIGVEAYRTKLPLLELEQALSKAGYSCGISNYAGAFICNEVYFRSLQNWQEHPNCLGILFVHLPPPAKYLESANDDSLNPIQCYAECLLEIGKFVYAKTNLFD